MNGRCLVLVQILLISLAVRAQTGVRFIENKGQWPREVVFRADLAGAVAWVEQGAVVIDRYDADMVAHLHGAHAGEAPGDPSQPIRHHAVRLRFVDATGPVAAEGLGEREGLHNYILGRDPAGWTNGCRGFTAVRFRELYPGIDVVLRAVNGGLKFDVVVIPGADVSRVKVTYDGADQVDLIDGRLTVHTSLGPLTETIPASWWTTDPYAMAAEREPAVCAYRKEGPYISYTAPPAHDGHFLVIDPVLKFSTYSGSLSDNFGYTATFDRDGFLYSGSSSFGMGYPTTVGAYQTTHAGGNGLGSGIDMALTKYDSTGTFLRWSTFLGGSNDELPHSLIVNASDELFVLGTTSSPDFPTTANAFDNSFNGGSALNLLGLGSNYVNGSDMVIARLSADGGTLLASTFLGGSGNDGMNTATGLKFNYADEIRGEILLDANDNVFVVSCTQSTNMPVSSSAVQATFAGGTHDAYAAKLDASLTTLIWGTYFGGSAADAGYSCELDVQGNLYITGGTRSADLPTSTGAVQPAFLGGNADAFVARLSADGSALLAATYWGTSAYDQAYFVELDKQGSVYLFGQTQAPGTQLIFNAPFNQPNSGQFLSKLSAGLNTQLWSSRFGTGGGTPNISPTAFLVDYCRKIYVSGWGSSIQGGTLSTTGLPITGDAFQLTTTGNDFYLAVFDIDMGALEYATFFGGDLSQEHVDGGTSRFDRRGRVYQSMCAGCGGNSDMPIAPLPGAWSPTNNSTNCNNGVFKFDFNLPVVVADFNTTLACHPSPVGFQNTSYGAVGYLWDFGDSNQSTSTSPTHVFPGPGVYTVTLIASDPNSCNLADTIQQQVVVLGNASYSLDPVQLCAGSSAQIGLLPIPDPGIQYLWSPPTGLSSITVANPIASPASTTNYQLLISNGVCTDVVQQTVQVVQASVGAGPDQTVCGPNATVLLGASSPAGADQYIWSTSPLFTDTLNSPLGNPTATVSVTATAWFHVQASFGPCTAVDSVLITVELGLASLAGDSLICADETASLSLVGVETGSTIVWSPEELIDDGQGTTLAAVSPLETTTYGVSVTSPAGCTWSSTITVNVSPVSGAEVTAGVDQPIVLAGTVVQLNATPATGVTYSWAPALLVSDPTIANPIAVINATTTFTVTVSDGICTRSATVTVRVYEFRCDDPDIFVPNAFTPNGDANNDVLYVRGRFITELLFRVFDRWGEMVFETTDQRIGWDGTFKGRASDPAVFVYYLDVVCEDGQTFFQKGNVTLIR
ncbi:MAG: gliding motility-associated C-terminal domain-containing protein [Flavobacteriales bacterium]|nr:gliding motility-associated C-terminal domain-containing protein [Flavobacteriales bacterium]